MTSLQVYVCGCATPNIYTRPSGQTLCLNCGLPLLKRPEPEARP